MRVTNALTTRDTIRSLSTGAARLAEAQERVTTGLRVRTVSDDPTAGTAIMQSSSALRAITQYQSNVRRVGSELDAEDSALDGVTQVLTRAKELAIASTGATASVSTREAAAAEVAELIKQVVQLGNTRLGEAYLFGGMSAATEPPFDEAQTATAPTYVAIPGGGSTPLVPSGVRTVEIASGQTMAGAHDGKTVFLDSGVFDALQSLHDALLTNTTTAVASAHGRLDVAFEAVQALVGDVGARQNQIDGIETSLGALEANVTAYRSDLSEVDMEQAITEMVSRQTAYQAAMLASSKVMGMSLLDYIR